MDEDNEYLKLPIEDQCVHKLWKARVHGYEAALKLFGQWDEKAPEWNKYTALMKKIVIDSNAVAQEKGLETVLCFVENSAQAGKTVGDVVSGLVAKCLGAPKARTKDMAVQIALMYVEIEKYEVVQEELMKGITTQKNPKVVAACIATLTQALREFGPKVVNLKLVLKQVPVLLEDRDKNVRDEGKKLVVELYRWIGQALKPQLSALKPIQVSELEAEFEKLGNEKPVQTRFLRSQQDLKAKMQAKASGEAPEEAGEDEVAAVAEIDPYELLEPVDILSQLPKDFYEKCEAKKWQERKEAMDSLEQLVANPKLQPGDYGDLVRALKKIVSKDTNVMVVAVAGKCLAGLANGLKKKFAPYALVCISTILEKFKEKKQNVVTAMREAIDAIYPSTTLEAVQEDVIAALDNKNPSVKAETTLFLARCFAKSNPTILNKKLLKAYCAPLLKTLNESDPAVRDGSAEALGTAMKVVGEKGIMPFLPDLEQIKMAKIKEFCDKAVISGRPAPKAAAAPAPKEEPVKAAPPPAAPAAAPAKRPGTVVLKKAAPKAAAGAAAGGKPAAAKKAAAAPKEEEKLERELSPEEAEEKAAAVLPADVMSGLGDSNWKTRLAAMESMMQTLNMLEKADIPAQAIIRTLCKKPGLKDTNFQVLKLKLEAVKLLAEKSEFSKRSGELCIAEVTEKLGDAKNSSGAIEALTAIADACGLEFSANHVLDFAMGQKNPKVQAESLVWLSNAIKEFGLVVQPKPLIEVTKKGLAATNPAVRTATITLLGTLYLYMGPPLRSFFEGEKPALLQQIDSEFEKHAGQSPPAPIRGAAVRKQAGSQANNEAAEVEEVNVVDLIPRTDISSQITESLITEMSDKNWKVRNEALQKVIAILNDAKYITPQLGELPAALAARMTDSNAILVQHALNICQTLATSMGPNCKQHVRILLPGMLQALSVNKPAIRSSAVSCLNTWVEQCNGMKDFFEGEMIADAIKGGNPYLKADLLTWLADRLPNINPRSLNREDVSACLPHVYAAIEDRSAEVRKGAQDVILPLMIHLGYETMAKAAGKLKPASKNLVLAQLDKARPNLPAKPAAAAPPPAPAAAPAPRAQIVSPTERNDDDLAPKAAPAAAAAKAKPVTKAKAGAAPAAAAPAASKGGRKKEEDVDTSPLLPLNTMKTQRINDELKLKVLKWNFAVPRDEFIEQLKEQMNNAGVNKTLMHNMFNADFKFHIKAIDSLLEDLPNNVEAQKANLDLILKWITLRFFDTNPSVLLKGLEYLQNLFTALSEIRYNLHDTEAASFIPYLILKVGDPKDAVKNGVHAIIKILWRIYPVSKLFPYVMEGIKSKNARQRTECLDELGALIEGYGVSVCQPSPSVALKEVAKQIADRDNAVRNAALNCITVAYALEGEKVYKLIGQLSDKDMSLLEERIKRSAKNKPAPAAAAAAAAKTPAAALQSSPESKVPAPRAGAARPLSAYMPSETKVQTRSEVEERPAPPPARPISGIFALELEETVQQAVLQGYAEHDIQIDLVQTNFEQLLNEPIPLIGSKLRAPTRSRAVTGSPAKLNGADETSFDLSISQFTHPSPNVSISAMQHVESVILKSGNESWLEVRVDQILIACAMQMRLLHSSQDRPVREVLQGCKAVIRLLMAIFGNAKLAQRALRDVLKDVTQYSLQIMIDSRLANEDEENQVVKSLNVLVLKMVEKSDHTAMTSALLKLLHESVAVENSNGKYIELVMKCLWRMVRNMPEWIDSLNTSVILMDVHLFLKAYPSSVWKDRQSDTPIRTIKTIIHTLVRLQGNAILTDLSSIENARDSELEAYIQKVVKSGVAKDKEARPPLEALESEKKDAAAKARRLSKSTQDTLTAIFRKIGDKEHTKEGLAELYEFKQRYPDADIEPFLRRSSEFFKKYIERGLKAIEQERMREQVSLQNANNNLSPESSAAAAAGDPLEPDAYMERLKKLRALAGLDTTQQGGSSAESHSVSASTAVVTSKLTMKTSSSVTIATETETVTTVNQSSGAPSEVELLRRRLEVLKKSGKIPQ